MKRMVLSSLFILAAPGLALATTSAMPDAQQGNLAKPAQAVETLPTDAAEALQAKKGLFDDALLTDADSDLPKPAASMADPTRVETSL